MRGPLDEQFRSALDRRRRLHPSRPADAGKEAARRRRRRRASARSRCRATAMRSADHRDDDRHRLQRRAGDAQGQAASRIDVDLVNLSGGGAMIARRRRRSTCGSRSILVLGDVQPDRMRRALDPRRPHRPRIRPRDPDRLRRRQARRDAARRPQAHLPRHRRGGRGRRPDPAGRSRRRPTARRRRAAPRRPSPSADLVRRKSTTITTSHRVRLRNISRERRAGRQRRSTYAEGAEVLLDLGDAGQHFATVSWSRGDQVGLRFASPFDIALLGAGQARGRDPQTGLARPISTDKARRRRLGESIGTAPACPSCTTTSRAWLKPLSIQSSSIRLLSSCVSRIRT